MDLEQALSDLVRGARSSNGVGIREVQQAQAICDRASDVLNAMKVILKELGNNGISNSSLDAAEAILGNQRNPVALAAQAQSIFPVGWWPSRDGAEARFSGALLNISDIERAFDVSCYVGDRRLVRAEFASLRAGLEQCAAKLRPILDSVPPITPAE